MNVSVIGLTHLLWGLGRMSRTDFLFFLSLAWVGLLTAIMIVLFIAP
jgi:hypothetical protein